MNNSFPDYMRRTRREWWRGYRDYIAGYCRRSPGSAYVAGYSTAVIDLASEGADHV